MTLQPPQEPAPKGPREIPRDSVRCQGSLVPKVPSGTGVYRYQGLLGPSVSSHEGYCPAWGGHWDQELPPQGVGGGKGDRATSLVLGRHAVFAFVLFPEEPEAAVPAPDPPSRSRGGGSASFFAKNTPPDAICVCKMCEVPFPFHQHPQPV